MDTTVRSLIAELEREFPAYQCWHVPVVVGLDHWCARRHDGATPLMLRTSAGDLQAAIELDIERHADAGGRWPS